MLSISMLRLDQLPPGITEYGRPDNVPRLPVQQFQAACKVVADHTDATVIDLVGHENWTGTHRNYHHATFWLSGHKVAVLCNYCYPFLGFVSPSETGDAKRTFLDPGVIGQSFLDLTDLKPLAPLFLETELTSTLLQALGKRELREIKFWRDHDTNVGNLVFNNWD